MGRNEVSGLRDHALAMRARLERMAGDARILPATEISVTALEEFYDQMYPGRAEFLKSNWRWLYRVGEYKSIPSPLVAMTADRIVGHGGLIPVTLRRGDEERTAIWMLDFGILPEYQRKAVGGLLVHTGMSLCPLQVAFLNERSWSMVAKLGWETSFQTTAFRLLLRPDQHPRLQQASTSVRTIQTLAGLAARTVWRARTFPCREPSVSPITASSLAVFSARNPGSVLHVPRSDQFLRWRISTNPFFDEHIVFNFQSGRNVGYSAVARLVNDRGYRRLHLLALGGDSSNRDALSDFFACIVRWAIKEDVHHILFITSDAAVAGTARWWFPFSKRLRFAYHANDFSGAEFLRGTDQLWEAIDCDFDLTYG